MTKTIEIDSEVTDAIVAEVSKSLKADFETQFAKSTADFEKKLADATKVADKEVSKIAGEDEEADKEVSKYAKLNKYEFAAEQFKSWVNNDRNTLRELNEIAVKSYQGNEVTKATYMNVATGADGGFVVPNNELLSEVFSLVSQYSEAASDIRVITLESGNGLDIATLVSDVIMTEVGAEGGNKTVTKAVLGDSDVNVREFAGIAILTKKLVRQAAINIFDLLAESFARAIAKKRAELILTDATSGIVNKAGVVEVETAGAIPTWAEVASMPFQAPAIARAGAKYYISATALASLAAQNDTTGRNLDLVSLDANGLGGTLKNGFRFAVEAGLGEGNDTHVVFGSLSRYGILLRQGTVENETFDTGTVVDGGSVSHNLLQQNKLAQRVAFYENAGFPLPAAFVRTVNAV